MGNQKDVVVVLTTGKQDRGMRATLAFGWACTALAMNRSVTVYLTMDGTIWAMNGTAKSVKVEGFEPLAEYIDQFLALDTHEDIFLIFIFFINLAIVVIILPIGAIYIAGDTLVRAPADASRIKGPADSCRAIALASVIA